MSQWEKIALVGVGLLGGSIGLAAKKRGLARTVEGYVRRPQSIAECLKAGAVDRADCDLNGVVSGADLIILCTPIAQMTALVTKMLPALAPGALLTDVGSVKAPVVAELEPLLLQAQAHFIGSHPMAGSEKMGVGAARADLFETAICAITPTPHSVPSWIERLERFWKDLGARPLRLTPDLHDDLVSRSSHLPHVVASELANYVLSPVHSREQGLLCANGFRDTTRIAAGSPEMWRDICLANRRNLARVLGVFIEDLQEFRLALERQDLQAIEEFFKQAKERRDAWENQTRSSPSPE
ncbi:MAG TPA: prephenate dehydrogenase/arogenate dehydrogenase family protein [Verrucomicrobiae bacterium]|nr:prephenate dehydrogenase/arogenate dehydrogenase family protein [Verrucomicrobiae bacterium]